MFCCLYYFKRQSMDDKVFLLVQTSELNSAEGVPETDQKILVNRRIALHKEFAIFYEDLKNQIYQKTDTTVDSIYRDIIVPCTQISKQLRKDGPKYKTLPIIKSLDKCDTIKWIEDFLALAKNAQWAPEKTRKKLLTFIDNEHHEVVKNLSVEMIIRYLIQETYNICKFDLYKARLKELKEINSVDIHHYIDKFAEFVTPLEIISIIYKESPLSVEEVEEYSRKLFYNGLLAKSKKVLLYTRAEQESIQKMCNILREHEILLQQELREAPLVEKTRYHIALAQETTFSKKGEKNRSKCVLHPKGNHPESECKLKKKIKQKNRECFSTDL